MVTLEEPAEGPVEGLRGTLRRRMHCALLGLLRKRRKSHSIACCCCDKERVLVDWEDGGEPRLEVVEEQHWVQAQLSEGELRERFGEVLEGGSVVRALAWKIVGLQTRVREIWLKKASSMEPVE